ncbi:hypothetical protein IMSAG025_00197 [Muribaculaceae bacterium]|nr:hypothetical protein IMSAG025_00197 [Muribaculaceae bacterium]
MDVAVRKFLAKSIWFFGVFNNILFRIHESDSCMILVIIHEFGEDLIRHGVVENMYRLGKYQFRKEKKYRNTYGTSKYCEDYI